MQKLSRARIATVALAAVTCGACGGNGDAAGGHESEAVDRGEEAVAAPPTKAAARFGIYHWGPDFSSWPGSPDKLTWGVDDVVGLGAHTIRLALTTNDDYGVNGSATTLAAIAQQPAWAATFSNPALTTFLLTVYTQGDEQNAWSSGYSAAQQQVERSEIAALGAYLLQTYAHKKFILQNWEGDNALTPYGTNLTAWNGYVSWIASRVGGVVDARKAVPGATSTLWSGLEYNAVKRLDTGAPCSAAGANLCVISYVAPKVRPDYHSYSSWQSLGTDTPTSGVQARLSADLTTAYDFVVAARPTLTRASFLVGEFGAARDISGECDAAAREAQVVDAITSWGASYGIAWQAIDNPPSSGAFDGFGRYKRDLTESLAGKTFQNLYRTQTPTVPPSTCGAISAGGVVNGVTFNSTIHPGDVISIFGSGFSLTGNTVWLHAGSSFFSVKAGSANWFESAGQINATLPPGVGVGSVNVYVTAASGRDTNGQLITVSP